MEKVNHCLACNQNEFNPYLTVRDLFGKGESFPLQICSNCELLLTNPRPTEDEILSYYKSNSYVSHGDSKGGLFDQVYQTIQRQNFKYKLQLINRYGLGKNILDYGCGAGRFIEYLSQKGFNVEGIEPDDTARELASRKLMVHSTINETARNSYDIISLYHVLEHIHQLSEALGAIKNKLDRNGALHLALPNYHSYDAQHYQEFWAGYDVPRHLYHFSQKSVVTMAETYGLKVIASHPLKFDSYYVSLLSEQYKKSKFAPIKAFWHGYRSNLKAKSTGEYSSLIYILTH